MKGDARVIEYLNRGLRHELTAINQYWLHYRLLDNWGYKDLAKYWRKESIEEMQHADKIVDRIIFLDGFPNMQVLDPLHIGQSVKEVLDCDLAAEYSARALYEEAATHCHSVKDYVTRDLFEKLMHDEEKHIDFLETQLELVSKLGCRTLLAAPHRQARRQQRLTASAWPRVQSLDVRSCAQPADTANCERYRCAAVAGSGRPIFINQIVNRGYRRAQDARAFISDFTAWPAATR